SVSTILTIHLLMVVLPATVITIIDTTRPTSKYTHTLSSTYSLPYELDKFYIAIMIYFLHLRSIIDQCLRYTTRQHPLNTIHQIYHKTAHEHHRRRYPLYQHGVQTHRP